MEIYEACHGLSLLGNNMRQVLEDTVTLYSSTRNLKLEMSKLHRVLIEATPKFPDDASTVPFPLDYVQDAGEPVTYLRVP